MRRLLTPHLLTAALLAIALFLLARPLFAQPSILSPLDVTYEGVTTVAVNGMSSTYTQGLTHRYVNGEQRFLVASPQAGAIDEFTASGAATGRWTIPSGTFDNHIGIWWEESKQRLWVTGATDYNANVQPSHISLLALPGTGGQAMLLWRGSVAGVNAKRMYGGCRAVPAYARVRIGGEYECGSGGYTSLLAQGGGAAIGPTMFAIDEPTTSPSGTALPLKRRVLDLNSQQARGVRLTIPENYFDGGDTRPNPPTRPTVPPVSSGQWLSPNPAGTGWMVWGDSYYNTCMWIDTTTRHGFACVMSGAKGKAWYQSSTLAFDGRLFELHIFDPGTLGSNPLQRPVSMTELVLPGRGAAHHKGNTTVENVAGATFDPVAGKMYLLSCGGDTTPYRYSCGLFRFRVNAGAPVPPPPPPPTPIDCVTGPWSGFGGWVPINATTEQRARTRMILTPAANGGAACGPLTDTETRSIVIAPPPPPDPDPTPTPEPDEMYEQLISLLKSIEAAVKAPELKGCRVTSTTINTITISRDCGIARPANGQILKVGE